MYLHGCEYNIIKYAGLCIYILTKRRIYKKNDNDGMLFGFVSALSLLFTFLGLVN